METIEKTTITVETAIKAPIKRVWFCFSEPKHIVLWNAASEDWHTRFAQNDLQAGRRFNWRMESKDGSHGFNFSGTYNMIEPFKCIDYTLDDGRKVHVSFEKKADETKVTETFEAEQFHSIELQKEGWQSILNNFRKYVEELKDSGKMHFEVFIDASTEKVYSIMLEKKTYSEWTSVFNPTSRYEGTWEKNSIIHFIGEDEDGNKGGMASRIRENIPGRFVSIEHYGILQGDIEITSGPEIEKWAGSLEEYTFEESNGKTLVCIDVDVNEEYKDFFKETWPKALSILKEMCETKGR
jgi:uncharacterized protein YndB with AHSA1/START domain